MKQAAQSPNLYPLESAYSALDEGAVHSVVSWYGASLVTAGRLAVFALDTRSHIRYVVPYLDTYKIEGHTLMGWIVYSTLQEDTRPHELTRILRSFTECETGWYWREAPQALKTAVSGSSYPIQEDVFISCERSWRHWLLHARRAALV